MNTKVYKEIKLPDGRIISIETGKLAKQADGSAVIQWEMLRFLLQ